MMVWALVLFLAAMVLIIAEVMLPGGVLGGIGALLLLVSTVIGVQAYPDLALFIIIGELLGGILCVLVGFFLLMKTNAGKAITQEGAQRIEDGYVNVPSETALVGLTGTVFTALRPAGTVLIGERRIDAVSDGMFLDKGSMIRVIEVHGNRVLVEGCEVKK